MKNITRITTVCLVITFALISCKEREHKVQYFNNISWYNGNELVIQDNFSYSNTVYDTITQTLKNDSLFPIKANDTSITFTYFTTKGYYKDDKVYQTTHLEKNVENIKYDFKYINNKPRLILYREPFPLILSTDSPLELPETKNFTPVKFIISEYSIGDKIDRSLLKTKGVYNYPKYTIEDCEFIGNKDITFKIIGYNTIYSIERKHIEDFRIQDIIEVVNSKLGVDHEYRPMRKWPNSSDYEYEFYRWEENGVQINLARSVYVGNASYKSLINSEDWILTYDDSFQQAILVETYRNGKSESSIIN